MSLIYMKMKTRFKAETHGNAEIALFWSHSITILTGLELAWNGGSCGEISEIEISHLHLKRPVALASLAG